MRIRFLFLGTIFLVGGLGISVFYGMKEAWSGWIPYLSQGLIVFLLVCLVIFYRKIVKPLNAIVNGMDLLREQDFSSRLSPVGQFESDRIVNIFNRMMDQLKNERLHVREQNHFLDLLINASPMGVIILSLDNKITQLNPMALNLLDVTLEEVQGKSLPDIQSSPLFDHLARLGKDETRIIRLNNANIYRCSHSSFIDHGFKHPFYLIERMTDDVMKAERKAYEKVIRMIAHEVNNSTAGITSALETMSQALADCPDMADVCDMMEVCHDRCLSMSHFITRFADVVKIPEPNITEVVLNDHVKSCARFMESMCVDRHIILRVECDVNVGIVRFDPYLFEQVMVNVIKNSMESIGHDGEITVSTVAPATVVVTDNGAGISEETEAKLFTPFFSTKPNGQGIGLVFIREVLMRHGCTFSLHTSADGMTRFCIQFPKKSYLF